MAGARSRRYNNGSLGDSWGTADYSDDGISIDSADSYSEEENQTNYFSEQHRSTLDNSEEDDEDDEDDMPTPMPHPRTTQASKTRQQDTPTKNSSSRPRVSRTQQLPPQQSPDPVFIMPSMHASANGYRLSPADFPLKHRKLRQTSLQSQGSRVPSRMSRPASGTHQGRAPKQEKPPELLHYLNFFWANFIWPVIRYIFGIFGDVMTLIKPLFGLLIVIILLVFALHSVSTFFQDIFHGIQLSLSPLCSIPLASYVFPLCKTVPSHGRQPDFDGLATVQSTFEQILDANKGSYGLPLHMKKSEIAVRNLRTQVKFSDLPSRSQLEVELGAFIEASRQAVYDLNRYTGRVGYVTDKVIASNRWTLQVLNGLVDGTQNTNALSRALSFVGLSTPSDTLQQRVFTRYVQHVETVKSDLASVIETSLALMKLLNKMDDHLDAIGDLATRDNMHVSRDHEKLLSELWTLLGRNKIPKAKMEESLALLRQLFTYRSRALEHVGATLLRLREIEAELENLREGIEAPEVVGYRKDVPLQYYIDVVERCVDRLADARGKDRALEWQGIKEGVERGLGGQRVEGEKGNLRGTRIDAPTVTVV